MRLVTRRPHGLGLEEGALVDGYAIEGFMARRGEAELVCQAIGPDGEPVTMVVAWKPPLDRHGWVEFRRAARARAALQHDALLPVRALGGHGGRPYLVTDRYPEATFADMLDGSRLPPERALPLLAQACDALRLAHADGLVHQSLSGTSLLLEGDSLILDGFGLAGGPPDLNFESVGLHEVRYSPPEALHGHALEPASNVYSLASLLVHALTGAPPYEGAPGAQAYGHLLEPLPVPSERVPELGTAFDDVIAGGMAKDPADRPASPLELLSNAAGALGVNLPTRPRSASPRPELRAHQKQGAPGAARSRIGRIPASAVLAVAAAAALCGVGAGFVIDPFEGTSSSASSPSADARALARLDERRTLLRARLSSSDTPQEQTATAAELADAYGRASRAVDSPSLASAAREAERAYAGLGAAGEGGSEAEFVAASDDVGRAEGRLAAAVARTR